MTSDCVRISLKDDVRLLLLDTEELQYNEEDMTFPSRVSCTTNSLYILVKKRAKGIPFFETFTSYTSSGIRNFRHVLRTKRLNVSDYGRSTTLGPGLCGFPGSYSKLNIL